MGGTTPTWLIPFPTGGDRLTDGDDHIRQLAERVDAVFTGQFRTANTAIIAPSTGPGWTNSGNYYQVRSGWVFLRIMGTRGTAWAAGTNVVYLPLQYAPEYTNTFVGLTSTTGAFIGLSIDTAGTVVSLGAGAAGAGGITATISYPYRY